MELKSSLCSSQTAPSSPAAAPRSAPPLAPRMENIPAGILPRSSVSSGNFGARGEDQNRARSAAAAPGGAGEVRLDCGAEPWHPQGGIWQLCSLSFHLPCLSRLLLQLQRQMVKKRKTQMFGEGRWMGLDFWMFCRDGDNSASDRFLVTGEQRWERNCCYSLGISVFL